MSDYEKVKNHKKIKLIAKNLYNRNMSIVTKCWQMLIYLIPLFRLFSYSVSRRLFHPLQLIEGPSIVWPFLLFHYLTLTVTLRKFTLRPSEMTLSFWYWSLWKTFSTQLTNVPRRAIYSLNFPWDGEKKLRVFRSLFLTYFSADTFERNRASNLHLHKKPKLDVS